MKMKVTLDDGRVMMYPSPDPDADLDPEAMQCVEPNELDAASFAFAIGDAVIVRGLDGYGVTFAAHDGAHAAAAAAAIRHIVRQAVELANRTHVVLVD